MTVLDLCNIYNSQSIMPLKGDLLIRHCGDTFSAGEGRSYTAASAQRYDIFGVTNNCI